MYDLQNIDEESLKLFVQLFMLRSLLDLLIILMGIVPRAFKKQKADS